MLKEMLIGRGISTYQVTGCGLPSFAACPLPEVRYDEALKSIHLNDTPAKESFSYKQLMLDLIVGGGIVTAASIPFFNAFGPVPALIFAAVIMVGWLLLGLLYFGRKNKASTCTFSAFHVKDESGSFI